MLADNDPNGKIPLVVAPAVKAVPVEAPNIGMPPVEPANGNDVKPAEPPKVGVPNCAPDPVGGEPAWATFDAGEDPGEVNPARCASRAMATFCAR